MGVERSVTRWYAKRQLLLDQIAQLEAQLAAATPGEASEGQATAPSQQEVNQRVEELARARQQLLLLGPCPKSAMV
jgi:cell division septum initiation protein DivIVA